MNKTELARDLALAATALGGVAAAVTTPDPETLTAAATGVLGLLAAILALCKAPKVSAALVAAEADVPVVAKAVPVLVPVAEAALKAVERAR